MSESQIQIYDAIEQARDGILIKIEFQPHVNPALIAAKIPFIRRVILRNEGDTPLPEMSFCAELILDAQRVNVEHTILGPTEPGAEIVLDNPHQFLQFNAIMMDGRERRSGVLSLWLAMAGDRANFANVPSPARQQNAETGSGDISADVSPDAPSAGRQDVAANAANVANIPVGAALEAARIGPKMALAINVSAANEFINLSGLQHYIAAFVQPNTAHVTTILRAASDFLMRKTRSGSIEGYQSGAKRAEEIAGAIYAAMCAFDITYINPPASFEETGQKVRTTQQVLSDHFGTCIDLSVAYAACLEAAGLSAVIFFTTNHAFPGFFRTGEIGSSALVSDPNTIANLIESQVIVPLEMIGIGKGIGSMNFKRATQAGSVYVRALFSQLRCMVDIQRARIDRILPLIGIEEDTLLPMTEETMKNVRPFVSFSALRSLHAWKAKEEVVTGRIEFKDDAPLRFRNWKRDLLDLSLRNPLLNLPKTSRVLDFIVPGGLLPQIDDAIHRGMALPLFPSIDTETDEKILGKRGLDEALDEANWGRIKQTFALYQHLYSHVGREKHYRQLNMMKRTAQTLKQETGSNYLYLTFGALIHPREKGGECRAPLFLLPVKLSRLTMIGNFNIKIDGDEPAQPNLCLLEWLRATQGLDLDALANPAADESGIAMGAVFTEIRAKLLEAGLPFRVDESCSLAILKFSTFQIWRDLDQNWRSLIENPVVNHLVYHAGETFKQDFPAGSQRFDAAGAKSPVAANAGISEEGVRQAPVAAGSNFGEGNMWQSPVAAGLNFGEGGMRQSISGDQGFDEESMRLPIAADGSQIKAIFQAVKGRSFVLEGPPGTGKSQTIANLIAYGIGQGKSILFVAAKEVALEVVKRRLDAIGVGCFTLSLYGSNVSMNDIRSQLKRSLEAIAYCDKGAYAAADARYRAAFRTLRDYPARAHSKNGWGYSYHRAYELMQNLGDGDSWTPDASAVGRIDLNRIETLLADFSGLASGVGLCAEAPWILCGGRFAAIAEAEQLARGLAGLADADRLIQSLSPEWRDMLGRLSPGIALNRTLELIRAGSEGRLPGAAQLLYIDRASWRDAVSEVRQGLENLARRHGAMLRVINLELLDSKMLDAWINQVRLIDQKGFFREWRKKKIRETVKACLASEMDLGGSGLLNLLCEAAVVRDASAGLAGAAARIAGLILPPDWRPHSPDAIACFDRAVAVSQGAVWLNGFEPEVWAFVVGVQKPPMFMDILGEIAHAWDVWLNLLGGDEISIAQWLSGRAWLSAWAHDTGVWQSDVEQTGNLQLQRYAALRACLNEMRDMGASDLSDKLARSVIPLDTLEIVFLRGIAEASLKEREGYGALDRFDANAQALAAETFNASTADLRAMEVSAGAERIINRRPFRADRVIGEVASLVRQIERKRGGMSFRKITRAYPQALRSLCPCFLMSPGAVAHFLDAEALKFDIVVFDEASQIRVPQAIGAIGRGHSVVITGDSKQMPPTRVMEVDAAGVAETEGEESDEPNVEDLESILSEAVESGLPQMWLSWHYRSREEQLIAFSNKQYYENRLVTLPAPVQSKEGAVRLCRVEGVFGRGRDRTNPVEAQAIVDEILRRLYDPDTQGDSMGVVCFNIQQRDLILDLLENTDDGLLQAALMDEPGRQLFVKNLENVQGDERDLILFSLAFSKDPATGILPLNFGPLNVGGGERRLNVAITRARKQVLIFASFNPEDINPARSGAKGIHDLKRYLEFAAASGIMHVEPKAASSAMQDEPKTTSNAMQGDLQGTSSVVHVEPQATSSAMHGDPQAASSATHVEPQKDNGADTAAKRVDSTGAVGMDTGAASVRATVADGTAANSRFAKSVADALRQSGYIVAMNVGLSDFKIDIAVKKQDDAYWRTAIILDTRTWYMRPTVIDRDGISELLKALKGWPSVVRVWLPGWVRDQAGEIKRIVKGIEDAPPCADGRTKASRLADVLAAERDGKSTFDGLAVEHGLKQTSDGLAAERQTSGVLAAEHDGGQTTGSVETGTSGTDCRDTGSDGKNAVEGHDGSAMPIRDTGIRDTNKALTVLPRDAFSKLADFVPAPTDQIYPKSALDRLNTAYPVICAGVQDILSVEGPVLIDRLIMIIYKRCGYSRLGAAKQRDLAALIRRSFSVDTAGFVWAAGIDPSAWPDVRCTANRGDRALEEICNEEIENAMVLVLRESLSIGRNELVLETGRKLGYERMGADNKARFDAIITKGLAAHRWMEERDRLRLA